MVNAATPVFRTEAFIDGAFRPALSGERCLDPAHPRMREPAHARGIALPAWGTS